MGIPTGGTTTPDLWLIGDVAYHTGVIQCTDGQTVATWPDQSGNGRDATAGTAPTWEVSQVNGHAAIGFNGVNTFLNNAFTGELGTVIVVYNTGVVGAFQDLLGANAIPGQSHVVRSP